MSVLRCFDGGAPPVLGLEPTMDLGGRRFRACATLNRPCLYSEAHRRSGADSGESPWTIASGKPRARCLPP